MSQLLRSSALALAALAAAAAPARAGVDAVVHGVVEDSLLHPLAGATVVLHDHAGATIARTTTSADGRFTFTVPFGDYTVEATAPGLVGDHQHVQLSSTEDKALELVLVSGDEVISVEETWAVPAPARATGSVTSLGRQQLAELPGGESRPITEVIATQPGFVPDALGNVYARGNHANLQYQVDGIPVPDSVGSLFAASIPVRLIQALEIATGGMAAEYGDRLGAVVNLVTRRGGDAAEGNVQLRYGSFGTVEPAGAYATTLGPVGVFVGGSYQATQRALDPPAIEPIVHDDGASARAFARVDWAPCAANRHELFVTYAHNRFAIPLDPTATPYDPSQPDGGRVPDAFGNDAPAYVPRDTDARETEDELFAAYAFTHAFADGGTLALAPTYKLSRGALFGDAARALGPTADPGATASDVTRLAHHLGATASYARTLGAHAIKLGAGADLLVGRTTYVAYGRDDDAGALDPALTVRGVDRTSALTTGAYAQDRITTGRWVIDAGVRVDELHVSLDGGGTDDALGVSPRLGAAFAPTKDAVVHAFAGVLWQPPAPLDAASAARALGAVPPGQVVRYDLRPETSAYGELGAAARLAGALRGGLTAWGRYAWNQLDDTAVGATSLLSNYNFARGRAAGLEATLDLRVGPWLSAFANGSLGLAQGQEIRSARYLFGADDLASAAWQTLDHAQTLTANLGATVREGRFTLTGVASYGSGLRTGPANTDHVPGHVHADVSMQYTFVSHGYPIRVATDVVNVLDARYAYRIANGFVGSAYAAPRSVFLTLSVPLAAEPHHDGEAGVR